MATAQTHYIRTIHTSFTAGLSSSSHVANPWAPSAPSHSNLLTGLSGIMMYPPGLGLGEWRGVPYHTPTVKKRAPMSRRSATPPPSINQAYSRSSFARDQNQNQYRHFQPPPPPTPSPRRLQFQHIIPGPPSSVPSMKFDPFFDDTPSQPLYNTPINYNVPSQSPSLSTQRQSKTRPRSLTSAASTRPNQPSLPPSALLTQPFTPSKQPSLQRSSTTLSVPPPVEKVTPVSPVVTVQQRKSIDRPTEGNREVHAKILAGLLLNRASGNGKPRPRRFSYAPSGAGRAYVKSGLSSVVSVEA